MHKIVITNMKGGVGKTSTALDIATCLGKIGKKVLAIDFDQQCNLSVFSEALNEEKTIFSTMNGDIPVKDAIQKKKYFDIISGSDALSRADRLFIDNDDKYLLDDILNIVADDYDYAIVDTSPARNILLVMAYVAADYIILPAECDEGSRMGLVSIESDIEKLKESRDKACHAEILGYILTKYEKTIMHDIAWSNLQELANQKKNPPFVMKVSKAINMAKIKTLHTSITEFAPSSTAGRDYYYITEEIIRRVEG